VMPLKQGINVKYAQVSAGSSHTVMLTTDGIACAVGGNHFGQCNIPPPSDPNVSATQVSAGSGHTLILYDNGQVVAVGSNDFGQCAIPKPEMGVDYVQISAGSWHTLLLCSDGSALAVGMNYNGSCNLPQVRNPAPWSKLSLTCPALPQKVEYIADFGGRAIYPTSSLIEQFGIDGSVQPTSSRQLSTQPPFCSSLALRANAQRCASLACAPKVVEDEEQSDGAGGEGWCNVVDMKVVRGDIEGRVTHGDIDNPFFSGDAWTLTDREAGSDAHRLPRDAWNGSGSGARDAWLIL